MHHEYGIQMGNDDPYPHYSSRKKTPLREELRKVRGRLRRALKKIREMEAELFYRRLYSRRRNT